MVDITPVVLADVPALAVLHQAAFAVSAWPEVMIAESVAQPYVVGLQLVERDTKLGFVLCQHVAGDCEILTYAVHPMVQRRGYGLQLLQAVYDHAKARQCERIFLEVAEDNIPALRLYTGFGFQSMGKRPAYYPRPTGAVAAILMQFVL